MANAKTKRGIHDGLCGPRGRCCIRRSAASSGVSSRRAARSKIARLFMGFDALPCRQHSDLRCEGPAEEGHDGGQVIVICRSLVPLGPPSKTVRPRRYMWDSENNIIAAEATEEPAKP